MKSFLLTTLVAAAVVVIAVMIAAVSADPGRAPSPFRPTLTITDLGNGRTRTRLSGQLTPGMKRRLEAMRGAAAASNNKNKPILNGILGAAAAPTDPPIEQALSMIFVLTNNCGKDLELTALSPVDNGGYIVAPPKAYPPMSSWHGFEAKVDYGQQEPAMNGTMSYHQKGMSDLYTLSIGFALGYGGWSVDCESATVWGLKLFSSEVDDRSGQDLNSAIYNIIIGMADVFEKPKC